jgi:(2Fe-2S) ferredoxin
LTIPTQPLEPLPGTVKLYQRHLFVCTGRTDWPSHIEQDGGYLQVLTEAVAAQAGRISQKVKITACDQASAGRDGYDLLVFPDAIRYLNVTPADFPALIEDHLIGNQPSPRLAYRPLTGDHHIFVCIHGRRDARCGECGPPLAERFEAEIAARGLTNEMTVYRTSHVGGHAYAGNVLVYPGGDWYGYVTPADVPRILDDHCLHGRILANHWRGRLGLTPEEQQEFVKRET